MSALHPQDKTIAQRWELYLGGIEIANAYSELWNEAEQRERMNSWAKQRLAQKRESYKLDHAFLEALKTPLKAGGIALGVDRLAMIFANEKKLDAVISFREQI